MQTQESPTVTKTGNLSIGTVSKLTGISVHTLRAWEKRHQVVSVVRSETGRRLYSSDDVQRLRLLRRLTQAGHSIGNIANLDNDALDAMLVLDVDSPDVDGGRDKIRVCIFSESQNTRFRLEDKVAQQVAFTAQTDDFAGVRKVLENDEADAMVFMFSTITIHHLRSLRLMTRQNGPVFFAVYSFAQRELIDELSSMGFVLLRAPVTMNYLLEKVCFRFNDNNDSQGLQSLPEEIPQHRYSRKQLKQLSKISTAIDCECPQHIANIIRSLNMFESYSQRCASKNEQDAMLHNDIYKLTAQARAQMETAIEIVVRAENIKLDSET